MFARLPNHDNFIWIINTLDGSMVLFTRDLTES